MNVRRHSGIGHVRVEEYSDTVCATSFWFVDYWGGVTRTCFKPFTRTTFSEHPAVGFQQWLKPHTKNFKRSTDTDLVKKRNKQEARESWSNSELQRWWWERDRLTTTSIAQDRKWELHFQLWFHLSIITDEQCRKFQRIWPDFQWDNTEKCVAKETISEIQSGWKRIPPREEVRAEWDPQLPTTSPSLEFWRRRNYTSSKDASESNNMTKCPQ